ncbi:hypothetical protein HPP92_006708 [Vanilla planifolia]|uniref:Uncharacterized protein n=1 Tax=Vanilla planifolia TaxID=51239 RepID=A0A835RCP5_VANPL|nr:hypothetical protein HPP92_006981 [Vanilla planifolia]KAG0489845.1 hypothetical protein HPP92_006708 [Vanilla planifolia]
MLLVLNFRQTCLYEGTNGGSFAPSQQEAPHFSDPNGDSVDIVVTILVLGFLRNSSGNYEGISRPSAVGVPSQPRNERQVLSLSLRVSFHVDFSGWWFQEVDPCEDVTDEDIRMAIQNATDESPRSLANELHDITNIYGSAWMRELGPIAEADRLNSSGSSTGTNLANAHLPSQIGSSETPVSDSQENLFDDMLREPDDVAPQRGKGSGNAAGPATGIQDSGRASWRQTQKGFSMEADPTAYQGSMACLLPSTQLPNDFECLYKHLKNLRSKRSGPFRAAFASCPVRRRTGLIYPAVEA